MAPSWAIPTGSLLGLVGAGILFFAWFFPRYWRKGMQHDLNEVYNVSDEERQARQVRNRATIENYKRKLAARERGDASFNEESAMGGVFELSERTVGCATPPPAYPQDEREAAAEQPWEPYAPAVVAREEGVEGVRAPEAAVVKGS